VSRGVLAGAVLLLGALLFAGLRPRPVAAPEGVRRQRASPLTPKAEPSESIGGGPRPLRDLFRYGDEAPAPLPRSAVAPPPRLVPPPLLADPVIRLVGVVRQPGGVRAAVAIQGEVVLLRRGETAEGWTLLSLGDDGVRLRGPDGHEEQLPLPE
jgi:hypothetical protein